MLFYLYYSGNTQRKIVNIIEHAQYYNYVFFSESLVFMPLNFSSKLCIIISLEDKHCCSLDQLVINYITTANNYV